MPAAAVRAAAESVVAAAATASTAFVYANGGCNVVPAGVGLHFNAWLKTTFHLFFLPNAEMMMMSTTACLVLFFATIFRRQFRLPLYDSPKLALLYGQWAH